MVQSAAPVAERDQANWTNLRKDRDPEGLIFALSCPVCYNVFHLCPLVLPCGHTFCENCLRKLAPNTNWMTCPICRKLSLLARVTNNFIIQDILECVREMDVDESSPILDVNTTIEKLRLKQEILKIQTCAKKNKEASEDLGFWKALAFGLGFWTLYQLLWKLFF